MAWGMAGDGQGCSRRQGTSEAAPEAVRQAVGGGCQSGWGGYCRLQMPLKPALGVRETVTGHRLRALKGGGLPPFQCTPSITAKFSSSHNTQGQEGAARPRSPGDEKGTLVPGLGIELGWPGPLGLAFLNTPNTSRRDALTALLRRWLGLVLQRARQQLGPPDSSAPSDRDVLEEGEGG